MKHPRKKRNRTTWPERLLHSAAEPHKNDSTATFRTVVLGLLALLLWGCDEPPVYTSYRPTDKATWNKEKTFYFSVDIQDTSHPYSLTLDIRNNTLYPYRNLWVVYQVEQPVGPFLTDTLECILADGHNKWRGNGFSLFTTSFPLKEQFVFPHPGLYTFSFSHIMTDEKLKGIHEIGFRIEKATSPQAR